MAVNRTETVPVRAGNRIIGADAPVSIQTMWKKKVRPGDTDTVLAALAEYALLGCDFIRFALPGAESLPVLSDIAEHSPVQVIADIHFDYTFALACMDTKIAKIRINPGNIGGREHAEAVIKKAADTGKALRIGINGGSLPRLLRKEPDAAAAMVKAAEIEMELLERMNFTQAVFSLKSSDIETTVQANIEFSRRYSYPLHIGVTEAGPLIQGVVKNTLGISRMLQAGIGNTVRVSLSDDPVSEIIAARSILSAENLLERSVNIVSCPQCGRSTFDVQGFLKEHLPLIQKSRKRCTIAVMGCEVNGPGEARHADIGITGAGNSVLFFQNGRIVEKAYVQDVQRILERLIEEL